MAYTPYTLAPVGRFRGRDATGRSEAPIWWMYKTEDAIGTVNTAGYFSDAGSRAMRAADAIRVVVMSGTTVSAVYLATVMSLTSGAANISNGISETLTDSD